MKLSAAIAIALIGVTSAPAFAGGPRFRHRQTHYEESCYKYVEEYVPGYWNKHQRWVGGFVRSEKKKVPCWSINRPSYPDRYEDPAPNVGGVDDNSCVEGAVLGGILGGGAGAAASRGDGRWWAIPLGIVGGSMLGCQVDGG